MGAMVGWTWAAAYPHEIGTLVALGAWPTAVTGRNLLWRLAARDALLASPTAGGSGARAAAAITMVGNVPPALLDRAAPDVATAQALLDARAAAAGDPVDLAFALDAVRTYAPQGKLDAVAATVVEVNFADDILYPPAEAPPLPARFTRITIPASAATSGHATLGVAGGLAAACRPGAQGGARPLTVPPHPPARAVPPHPEARAAPPPPRPFSPIRAATAADRDDIAALLDAAFGPGRHARTASRLRAGAVPLAGPSLVARDASGALIGSIQFWPMTLVAADATVPLTLLGPVAVAAAARSLGLGRRLIAASLAIADAARPRPDPADRRPQLLRPVRLHRRRDRRLDAARPGRARAAAAPPARVGAAARGSATSSRRTRWRARFRLWRRPMADLSEIAALVAGQKVPPVETWHPTHCGDSHMRIAADGTWFHEGSPIGRPELVRLFSTILRREAGRRLRPRHAGREARHRRRRRAVRRGRGDERGGGAATAGSPSASTPATMSSPGPTTRCG